MHYNYLSMLKATAQAAAEGQVAGYTSLHRTECFFAQGFSNQEHSNISVHFTRLWELEQWRWEFHGILLSLQIEAGCSLVKTSHSGVNTRPLTRLCVQRCNYPPPYQGQHSQEGIPRFLVPGSHSDQSLSRLGAKREQAGKSISHGLLPFPYDTPSSLSFPPKGRNKKKKTQKERK